MHRRTEPVEHAFSIPLFYFALDLDEIGEVTHRLSLVSHNRANIYSFRDDDHLYLGAETVRENLTQYLATKGIPAPARILLVTHLRTFGHVFNPVSFYFCEDAAGKLTAVVSEVHNTYGELKPFLLTNPDERGTLTDTQDKEFYISPFSDLDTQFHFKLRRPGEKLGITINQSQGGRLYFRSALTGERRPLTNRALLGETARFPFVTLKVIGLIHWHAFRLWRKGLPVRSKSQLNDQQRGILPKRHQPGAPKPVTTT